MKTKIIQIVRQLRVRRSIAVALASAVVLGGFALTDNARLNGLHTSEAALTAQVDLVQKKIAKRDDALTAASKLTDPAQKALHLDGVSSVDPAMVASVKTAMSTLKDRTAAQRKQLSALSARIQSPKLRQGVWPADIDASVRTVKRATLPADTVAAAGAALKTATEHLTDAVAAWKQQELERQQEQQRLAEQAAAQAAQQAAARAARAAQVARAATRTAPSATRTSTGAPAPAAAPASVDTTRHVYVRASADGMNVASLQAAVDAGGHILANYAPLGISMVVAHNGNDGNVVLSLHPGDLVQFTGALNGTFRATGSMDISRTTGLVNDLLALGTPYLMGTCNWTGGTEHYVGLVRVS